jgi:Tfp pilus assembly protein PilO
MLESQMRRLWLFVGAVAALLLLLIGWFLFISPQRSQTSSVNGQVSQAKHQNTLLKARIRSLQAQNANLSQYQSELAQAKLALPDSSGLSDFLRTLQSIGNATQTNVTSLTVGAPQSLKTLTGSVAGASAATSAARSAPGTAPTGAPAAAAAAAPAATTALGSIYQLPIVLSVSGSVAQLDDFLGQLQSVQPRAVLITQLIEGAQAAANTKSAPHLSTLGLTMQAFVAPSSAAENAQLAAGVKPSAK